jgi:PRTRC genetic system protein B
MDCHINLQGADSLSLQGAILVYKGTRDVFASWHEATVGKGTAPQLGPALPLSTMFLKSLAEGLGSNLRTELLPPNVLVRTPDTLVWWTPATCRRMFFSQSDEILGPLSGRSFPHPALVFRVSGRELRIRAISQSKRPDATTPLFVAPYYNTQESGLVCQGSMRSPDGPLVNAMTAWEDAFFASEFTHLWGGGRMCRHKQGVAGLWKSLEGAKVFPVRLLANARQTLQQFVGRDHD